MRWISRFASLRNLHGRLSEVDATQANAGLDPLLDRVGAVVAKLAPPAEPVERTDAAASRRPERSCGQIVEDRA